MWTQLAGMGLSMASSILGSVDESAKIDQLNAFNKQQWENNVAITSEMIGTLSERTDRAYDDATQQAVRTKMSVIRAGIEAKGEAEVKAAAIGIQGKRATREITRDISRAEAEAISDANINLQTELSNITEYFNDTANRAIMNLNNARPVYQETPGIQDILLSAGLSGFEYYRGMSDASKAEISAGFNDFFKKESAVPESLLNVPLGVSTKLS